MTALALILCRVGLHKLGPMQAFFGEVGSGVGRECLRCKRYRRLIVQFSNKPWVDK
jgi:hypothetical protein